MNKLFIIIVVAMAFLASCTQDDVSLNNNLSGGVSVQLSDANGAPIADAKVSLSTGDQRNIQIDELVTDANGQIEFTKLNPGTYTISSQAVKDGDYLYNFKKTVYAVSSEVNTISVVPSDYNASVALTIMEKGEETLPLGDDIKVALIKIPEGVSTFYYQPENFEVAMENMVKEIPADGVKKEFTFSGLPLGSYVVMVYSHRSFYNFEDSESLLDLKKGETRSFNHTFNSKWIRRFDVERPFLVQKSVMNPTTSTKEIVGYEGCKIYVLAWREYERLTNPTDITAVEAMALSTSVTDVDGNTTFGIPDGRLLRAVFFAPDNTYLGVKGCDTNHGSTYTVKFVYEEE